MDDAGVVEPLLTSPSRLSRAELLIALTGAALRETTADIELLQSRPTRDDAQFGDRPRPLNVTSLDAWLYSPSKRVAYAVHTPDWTPATPASTSTPSSADALAGWTAILREHLHGDFHDLQGWTDVNAVAMPVRLPFDEPGLKIRPLLALGWPVSQDGTHWFSEAMTATLRNACPYVVPVLVFSAALYLARTYPIRHFDPPPGANGTEASGDHRER
jgi:hypothetical protein